MDLISETLEEFSEVRIQDHFVDDNKDAEYRGWREFKNVGRYRIGPVRFELRNGELFCNDRNVICYRSPIQLWGNPIAGKSLRRELKGKQSLTFCHMIYMIRHQELIWPLRDTPIFFWGTSLTKDGVGEFVGSLKWARDASPAGGCWWAQFSRWNGHRENTDSALIIDL